VRVRLCVVCAGALVCGVRGCAVARCVRVCVVRGCACVWVWCGVFMLGYIRLG
jgi:hypothetical protein